MYTLTLAEYVALKVPQMERYMFQAVANAMNEGANTLFFGKYSETGRRVLEVEVPKRWRHLEAWRNARCVWCFID